MHALADGWHAFATQGIAYLLGVAALSMVLLTRRWQTEQVVLRTTMSLLGVALVVQLAGALAISAGGATIGAVVRDIGWVASGLAVIRLAGLAVFRAVLPVLRFAPPRIVEDIAVVVAYFGWGLLQLRVAGVDPSSLVTTSAVITAVLAFSMQDTLGNVLGGLFLELDESLTIGDWVRIDDVAGRVEQIRWRHTAIRTRNGELVIVPNSTLMRTRFMVIGDPDSASTAWRRWIWFDTTRAIAPGRVIAAAEGMFATAEVDNLAPGHPPSCVLMEMNHGYLRFALRYWMRDPGPDDRTDTVVRLHLYAALQRAGIELASPEQVIRNVFETQRRAEAEEAREFQRRRAALSSVELFAGLSAGELDTLAARLVYAPFTAGDVITRQGAVAHWLYLLSAGEVDVCIERAGGPRHRVASMAASGFFGEMGLLTGAPRRATVIARSDVECYRLDKAGFEDILHARPAIAEQISEVLLAREHDLDRALTAADANASAAGGLSPASLIARIRAFFGLADTA